MQVIHSTNCHNAPVQYVAVWVLTKSNRHIGVFDSLASAHRYALDVMGVDMYAKGSKWNAYRNVLHLTGRNGDSFDRNQPAPASIEITHVNA